MLTRAIISSDARNARIISKELRVQKLSNAPCAELMEKSAKCTCDQDSNAAARGIARRG